MTPVPVRQPSTSRSQVNAPVNICVYKITEASGDVWPQFPLTKIWQVQMEQDTRPSGNRILVSGVKFCDGSSLEGEGSYRL